MSQTTANPKSKSRQIFVLCTFLLTAIGLWAIQTYFEPDQNGTRLSARPAPARPHIEDQWLATPPMQRFTLTLQMAKGDNLMKMLLAQGIDSVTADAALDALREIYDPRQLKVGQKIRLYYQHQNSETKNQAKFAGLDFIPAPSERVIVRHVFDKGFQAVTANRPLTDKRFLTDTKISSSLYSSARATGMSPKLVLELIKLFSFTIDFQREIREGDRLEVLYTRRFDDNGDVADEGEILFAALTNKGARKAYWRFERDPETIGYYDDTGESLERLLMKTPLDGARLSSRYGMRKHPILGYTRLHKGVDFAARTGTPIYAAGDGKILAIGRDGDWGKRIRIQHEKGFETFYAHLSRYAKNLKRGDSVKQGQVIGYVGRTGLATGPHLHFEVWKETQTMNPLNLSLPPRHLITETETTAFRQTRKEIDDTVKTLAAGL